MAHVSELAGWRELWEIGSDLGGLSASQRAPGARRQVSGSVRLWRQVWRVYRQTFGPFFVGVYMDFCFLLFKRDESY